MSRPAVDWYLTSGTDNNVTVQIRDIAEGDYTLDWGDGSSTTSGTYVAGQVPEWGHLYSATGSYTVTVTDAVAAAHAATVKVPIVKAKINTLNPIGARIGDPTTTVNAAGVFDGTQKAYVDGIEVPTTSASGTGFAFQATPATFPFEEGAHTVYAAQADGSRSNGMLFTVFPALARKSRAKK